MNLVRDSEIYINRRLGHALSLAAKTLEGDNDMDTPASPENLAGKYLEECLSRDFPGIFDCIDACETAYELVLKDNKKRSNQWKETLKRKVALAAEISLPN